MNAETKKLKAICEDMVMSGEIGLAKFADSVSNTPVHALTWAMSVFTDAARNSVGSEILDAFEKGQPDSDEFCEAIKKHCTRNAMHKTLYPPRSTSVTSNLMETELASAYAFVMDRMGWM